MAVQPLVVPAEPTIGGAHVAAMGAWGASGNATAGRLPSWVCPWESGDRGAGEQGQGEKQA